MTWEIGTTFQQDCNVFDSAVVDKNIRALNYAASLTHQPYILSKGPDIVYLNVSPTQWNLSQGQVMDIRVRASDEEMIANGNFATAKQDVVEIQLFFDKHPYEASFPDWILDKSQVSKKGEGELQLEWDAVSQLLAGDLFAKHVIYVQAVDSDGDVGPILSVSFAVFGLPTESPSTSAVPSSHPTSSLSESPTDEPPTALPTSPSPATRTSLPTKEPTSPTSPTAPSDCKDTDSEICDFILARGRFDVSCDVVSKATSCHLTCGLCFGFLFFLMMLNNGSINLRRHRNWAIKLPLFLLGPSFCYHNHDNNNHDNASTSMNWGGPKTSKAAVLEYGEPTTYNHGMCFAVL